MERALVLLAPGRTEREIARGGQRAMEDAATLDVAVNASCYMQ